MAERHDIHVVPHDHEGWLIRRENEDQPIGTYATQAEAEVAGRTIAKEEKVELFVHSHTGQIRDRSTYGHDPRNIPG
ncbi:DUF2188 domain-containing protein [Modestobacter sp. KNN46-3]|jgi:hypothetical protein|uniref:DUF2188 domain-containing protein n=1 Tax=Modestobacter sp. KNN46-3 TaxID=2711218 RepID=UPI0013E05C25|nr:DUF2188 domain-containing protein [Modestobacter sp. KNN46-3]